MAPLSEEIACDRRCGRERDPPRSVHSRHEAAMTGISRPLRVSLLAFPDAVVSTLTGIYDVLSAFSMLAGMDEAIPDDPPFMVEIVGAEPGAVALASGMPLV